MEAPARCFSHARPQYDRDGVLCKPGDTVFGLGREQHRYKVLLEERDVEKCEPYDHGRFTLPCLDLTDGDECVSFLDPRMVSHKEPGSYEELQEMLCKESSEEDSYKKVRDDLLAAQENWDGDPNNLLVYADRITALMEQER